ncbi:hypothetical protein OAK94_00545 [bacterium]|nr:hypothetical protein [bacterium]MDB4792517.1 hypothetical protein [bacterium]MDC0270171.1 hypothetical protein [bacterium]
MINPFKPLELLPYIREEEYASALIRRFVGASQLEQQRMMGQARELGRAPIVGAFHFPDFKTGETENLLLFEGFATAEKTALTASGEFKKQKISIPQILAIDKQKKFEFTLEHNAKERVAFITVCEIYRQHRRKGYFPRMVGAIQDYCFNQLGVRTVLGNARPPREEATQDWRTKRVTHCSSTAKITALQSLWLRQPYGVFGAMIGDDDPDSFAFLNPSLLGEFTEEDFAEWDAATPHKPKAHRFIELMKEVAA